MRNLMIVGTLALAGCVDAPKTAEGCPRYHSEIMRAYTEECQKIYYEERARASGGTVTRCFGETANMTCVSE